MRSDHSPERRPGSEEDLGVMILHGVGTSLGRTILRPRLCCCLDRTFVFLVRSHGGSSRVRRSWAIEPIVGIHVYVLVFVSILVGIFVLCFDQVDLIDRLLREDRIRGIGYVKLGSIEIAFAFFLVGPSMMEEI